jgi:hypothetical protein
LVIVEVRVFPIWGCLGHIYASSSPAFKLPLWSSLFPG